jgi:hypothetical protein
MLAVSAAGPGCLTGSGLNARLRPMASNVLAINGYLKIIPAFHSAILWQVLRLHGIRGRKFRYRFEYTIE